MPGRNHSPYPPEFRAEAIKLAHSSDKRLSEVAADLGIATETLRNWLKQQDIDTGKRDGVSTDEREELNRLRRENKILKEEKERWSALRRSRWRSMNSGSGPLLCETNWYLPTDLREGRRPELRCNGRGSPRPGR